MICKLCLESKKILKSHIIPEFIYKPLYDDKHRFREISTSKEHKTRFQQKGIRERLLCRDCEQHLSRYENYVSKVLNGGIEIVFRRFPRYIQLESLKYTEFKLFQMSLLFRASVSTIRYFEDVKLSKPQESELRDMILNENPGEPHHYGCCIVMLYLNDKLIEDFILQPELMDIFGFDCYRFIFGGGLWLFNVSTNAREFPLKELFIGSDGKLMILKKHFENTELMQKFAYNLYITGKLDDI